MKPRFAFMALIVSLLSIAACHSGSEDDGGNGGAGGMDTGVTTTSRVDLLLVIDNSRSMADKQGVLALTIPDLLDSLTNPPCVDAAGVPAIQQPTEPLAPCPAADSTRQFEPVDIHIGVITSSLGGHGGDACAASTEPTENDQGQLITRTSTDGSTAPISSWQDKGFLVWDPDPQNPTHNPPGESSQAALIDDLQQIVQGAGELGCGFEATLESWYRFLIEPDPHQSITIDNNEAILVGTDQVLLSQRHDFLRPDSALVIMMLSDENDCSIRDGGQFYFAAQVFAPQSASPFHLPKPRAACQTDPNSPCCASCGMTPGEGCDTSQDDCGSGPLTALEDHISLRCFDQKRRFGIDFLYPIERYAEGLTASQVTDRHGELQPNPLFVDLDPNDDLTEIRARSLVFLAGVVGVPWQDIARRAADGTPDLLIGSDAAGLPVGGFQDADQLVELGTWDVILGDPENDVSPTDPLMIESIDPRSGTNPITGDVIQPPSAPEGANPINGHEYTNDFRGDLQYACIFPLLADRDCGPGSTEVACECDDPGNDNPLCVPNPADNNNPTLQRYAKAYPSRRLLSALKAAGTQGIVASLCPAQLDDSLMFDFGYRPAGAAILERLVPRLHTTLPPSTQASSTQDGG